jgi:DNA-binding NtrC family response regulator
MAGGETKPDEVADAIESRVRPGVVMVFSTGRAQVKPVALPPRGVELGRDLLEVDDERVSRKHAHVAYRDGRWHVRDLGSRNASWLAGRELREAEQTAVGDAILRIGQTVLLLVEDARAFDRHLTASAGDEPWIGPRTRTLMADVDRAARDADTLLITGPSGSGKEHVAERYHTASARKGRFVSVNCAAIPEGLAERVLFGAKRGVYTGADADTDGYFGAADGGTIFLDELAELSPMVQAKLLRVIETHEVDPLGATRTRPIDVRIVTATHQNVRAMVAAGEFRQDLYYRLSTPSVRVPSLAERPEDVPILMERACRKIDPSLTLSATLVADACERPWPGNIRELLKSTAVAAAAARDAKSAEVTLAHLDPHAGRPLATSRREPTELSPPELERALSDNAGNIAATARALGLHRTQLYRLLDKHGLARE